MRKLSQSYILDLFLDNIQGNQVKVGKFIDTASAKNLYALWKNPKNFISGKMYKIPQELPKTAIENMQSQGMIVKIGDSIQMTQKGMEIIKTMILGNDKSSFEKDYDSIEYRYAKNNVDSRMLKAQSKKKNNDWWDQF